MRWDLLIWFHLIWKRFTRLLFTYFVEPFSVFHWGKKTDTHTHTCVLSNNNNIQMTQMEWKFNAKNARANCEQNQIQYSIRFLKCFVL